MKMLRQKYGTMDYYELMQLALNIVEATARNNISSAVGDLIDKLQGRNLHEIVIITENPYLLQLNPRCVLSEKFDKIEILVNGGKGKISVMNSQEFMRTIRQIRV